MRLSARPPEGFAPRSKPQAAAATPPPTTDLHKCKYRIVV